MSISFGTQYTKLKTNLRLAINRLKLLEKKKTEMAQKSRKEIADFIAAHKEDRARIRVEHIVREDYMVEAFELLEMYCDLILARFGLIQQMKTLDEGIEEAVNSLVWAAPRLLSDVQEFKIISDQLTAKYGKEFAEACRQNQFNKVNPKLLQKLGVQAPPKILVEKYMIEIAKSHGVPFTPDADVMRDDEVATAEAMLVDFQNQGQQGVGWMYPQPPGGEGGEELPQVPRGPPGGGGAPHYPGGGGGGGAMAQQPFNYPPLNSQSADALPMKMPPFDAGDASAPPALQPQHNYGEKATGPPPDYAGNARSALPPPPEPPGAMIFPTIPDDAFPAPPPALPHLGGPGGGAPGTPGGGDPRGGVSGTGGASSGGADDLDFDDLNKRFEDLKKRR